MSSLHGAGHVADVVVAFFPHWMWTKASRGRMAELEKRTKRYPTDLTDEGWEIIDPFLPPPPQRGRRPPTDLREALNAPRYLARSGGGCRRRTFRPGTLRGGSGVLFASRCCALSLDREREGREQGLTAAIVDRRSIKAPAPPQRGVDAAGKVVGPQAPHSRRSFTGADISDSAEVREIVAAIGKRWPWLKHLCADGAYDRTRLMDTAACRDFVLEIIGRTEKQAGFKVLPQRRSSNEPLDG